MSGYLDNRTRAFADVLAIDAWHEAFDSEYATADLHADVVFSTARVGGEPESDVRFRLRLRRAELVVIIPETEPLSVDKRSVSRDSQNQNARVTEILEHSGKSRAAASGSVNLGLESSSAGIALSADTSLEVSEVRKMEIDTEGPLMAVIQSLTPDGFYRWSIETRTRQPLNGRPWDGTLSPRLKLIDTRSDRTRGIPPTVRIEVRCRREDIDIFDIEIKNENVWQKVKRRAGFRNRIAAAEAYIRDRLASEGLSAQNLNDKFGQLTLGATTAESIPRYPK